MEGQNRFRCLTDDRVHRVLGSFISSSSLPPVPFVSSLDSYTLCAISPGKRFGCWSRFQFLGPLYRTVLVPSCLFTDSLGFLYPTLFLSCTPRFPDAPPCLPAYFFSYWGTGQPVSCSFTMFNFFRFLLKFVETSTWLLEAIFILYQIVSCRFLRRGSLDASPIKYYGTVFSSAARFPLAIPFHVVPVTQTILSISWGFISFFWGLRDS